MKRIFNQPWAAIILVLIACIRYEYQTESSRTLFDGFSIGIAVISIIAIVIGFKITTAWAQILYQKKIISSIPRHPYDILLPIGIIAAAWGYSNQGKLIKGIDDSMTPQWIFEWGNRDLNGYFILSLIGLVLLLRIYAIVKFIELEDKPEIPNKTVDTYFK